MSTDALIQSDLERPTNDDGMPPDDADAESGASDDDEAAAVSQHDRSHRKRRRRRDAPHATNTPQRAFCLALATVVFFAVAIGLGAANFYSPLRCFGQHEHVAPTESRSVMVLASAFFACGTMSLVVVGFAIGMVLCCATILVKTARDCFASPRCL